MEMATLQLSRLTRTFIDSVVCVCRPAEVISVALIRLATDS